MRAEMKVFGKSWQEVRSRWKLRSGSEICDNRAEVVERSYYIKSRKENPNQSRLPHKTTSEPSKVVRACGVFHILTWKYASRHKFTFSKFQLPEVLPNHW